MATLLKNYIYVTRNLLNVDDPEDDISSDGWGDDSSQEGSRDGWG